MADKHYLWSNLSDGGEVMLVPNKSGGGERTVVTSRNLLPAGSPISESDAADEAEWESWLEAGVARPYPYPEDLEPGSTDSPVVHLQKKLAEAAESQEELLTAQVAGVMDSAEALSAKAAEADKAPAAKAASK